MSSPRDFIQGVKVLRKPTWVMPTERIQQGDFVHPLVFSTGSSLGIRTVEQVAMAEGRPSRVTDKTATIATDNLMKVNIL